MTGRYIDFSLGIDSTPGGKLRVRACSPYAEAESLTQFEFGLDRLNDGLRAQRSGTLRDSLTRNLSLQAGPPSADRDWVEAGQTLFAALFTGEVGELYSATWNSALEATHGLRIRLHLNPRNPELAWLTKVPWEIMFDERVGAFPCLNPLTPLVRHLDLPRPVERIPFQLPLRVLVVAANPVGLMELDLRGEQEAMEASQVRVKVLENEDPEDLRRELLQGKHQIVHFMGHGLRDDDQGSLVFSRPGGQPRFVTGSHLSHMMQGAPTLGLTLLNACHSASVPQGHGADPLAGVAGALVRGGQSAVVGMQFTISDRAALTFSRVLYTRLAEGEPIEAAVSEARLALYLADSRASDWIAPVLFLRGSDQRIEESEMREEPSKRDVARVEVKADVVESDEVVLTGAHLASPAQDSSERLPSESHLSIETGRVTTKKFIVTGSDHRNTKVKA